jgi:drug/metabolite transporter (DMT)-like permease
MELWIPITIAAAFFQNIRSALQKVLKEALSDTGATFVRFGFGFPLALAYLAFLVAWLDEPLPEPNSSFLVFGLMGGTSQILATFLLVRLFSLRNFAVGTAYSKTEPIQAAVFGFVLLQESLDVQAGLAIALSTLGVCALSVARSDWTRASLTRAVIGRPALIGLASGALFGLSAVAYRSASLSLGGEGFLIPAAYTLACVTVYQTLAMVIYLIWREPGQLSCVLQNWRPSLWVGVSGIAGSIGWFTAMTIQTAAYVRALGQIELLFTFLVSVFYFHEKVNRLEVAGISAIVVGLVYLLSMG